ncbi:CPBP family intramembrane glutamic endopeptidase [Flavitalea flava]
MSPAKGNSLTSFVSYLKTYIRHTSLKNVGFTLLFVSLLITLNYTIGIERRIRDLQPWPLSLLGFFFFYGFVFFFTWAIQFSISRPKDLSADANLADGPSVGTGLFKRKNFLLLLLLGPLYFSFKMIHWDLSIFLPSTGQYPWSRYAQVVLQLPFKLLLLGLVLYGCWLIDSGPRSEMDQQTEMDRQMGKGPFSFYGLTVKNFRARPYLLILLCLVPLIALASTQPDFLHTYPKLRNVDFVGGYSKLLWPWQLGYELSYGLDFVSIELFFRGFLVIALARYAGQYAILPMAAFYCSIHFGKPLGECISSFFGGLALGVIAWRTRSILGGLIVHLGLAWLMEVGGYIGNLYF